MGPEEQALWTPRRIELRGWLQRHAPGLAALYEGAVRLVCAPPVSGRVRFVAHAIREICNRLPNAVSGVEAEARVDYKTRLDEIATAWERSGLSLDGSAPEIFAGDTPLAEGPKKVSVDRALILSIVTLVRDHAEGRKRPEENAARLFEAISPENQALRDTLTPVIRQWVEIGRWSVARAHDWKLVDGDYPEGELQRQFGLFETTLGALVGGFFEAAGELDEILEETNS